MSKSFVELGCDRQFRRPKTNEDNKSALLDTKERRMEGEKGQRRSERQQRQTQLQDEMREERMAMNSG